MSVESGAGTAVKRLWRIEIEVAPILVAAEDFEDAYETARESIWDAIRDAEPSIYVASDKPLQSADEIPSDWKGCIPYGGDGRSRVEDYFALFSAGGPSNG